MQQMLLIKHWPYKIYKRPYTYSILHAYEVVPVKIYLATQTDMWCKVGVQRHTWEPSIWPGCKTEWSPCNAAAAYRHNDTWPVDLGVIKYMVRPVRPVVNCFNCFHNFQQVVNPRSKPLIYIEWYKATSLWKSITYYINHFENVLLMEILTISIARSATERGRGEGAGATPTTSASFARLKAYS